MDGQFLLFNRVPKTGSELFAKLLQTLAENNGFRHTRYGAPQPRKLGEEEQVKDCCAAHVQSLL